MLGRSRDQIQIAFRVGSIKIDRWWNDACLQSSDASNGLDRSRRTDQMSEHALCRADSKLRSGRPKRFFQSQRLGDVVCFCSRTVGIDVGAGRDF
mgnify:CR=1 FL=1